MKKQSIVQLIKAYKNSFGDDWIEKLSWEKEPLESLKQGIKTISDFENQFFELFAKSILSGEYILSGNKLIALFDDFTNLIRIEFPPTDNNTYKDNVYLKFSILLRNIDVILKHYHIFIDLINRKTICDFKNSFINVFSTQNGELTISLFIDLRDLFFEIAFLDHNNIYEDDRINHLIFHYNTIQNRKKDLKLYPYLSLYEMLSEKCFFLLKKLSFFNGNEVEYYVDFIKQKIVTEEGNNTGYNNYDKSFSYFYRNKNIERDKLIQWQKDCQIGNGNIRSWKIILLMRHYKKEPNNYQRIKNLVSIFDEYYLDIIGKEKTNFNIYALKTIKNFMHNCMFSYRIKFHEKTYLFSEMDEDLEKIINIQDETSIKNYYPYKKALAYLLLSIKEDILNDKKEEIEKKKVWIDRCLCYYKESLNWCKETEFYPFQLPYNECVNRDNGLQLFYPSSFCKVINYSEKFKEFSKTEIDIKFIENEIKLQIKMDELKEIKTKVQETKNDLIKILTLFITIFTFLFSSISIYGDKTKDISFSDKIENTSILGFILLLFSSLMYFISSNDNKFIKNSRIWVFITIIIISLSGLIIFYFKSIEPIVPIVVPIVK